MIKTTIGKTEEQEKSFPKLMMSRFSQAIVFFESDKKGQVIRGDSDSMPGEIYSGWSAADFEDYNEPVTIQNVSG